MISQNVIQGQTEYPTIHGNCALLGLLSDEEGRSVHLVVHGDSNRPLVRKPIPDATTSAAEQSALARQDVGMLAQLHSPFLAEVLATMETGANDAFVMDYIHGKSLEEIRARAEATSTLLPPELGLVVAHDVLAAMQYFHDFAGAGRVHGNLSTRTILLNYAGEAKIAGYRPGAHGRAAADVLFERDVRPLASILCDLPFEMFPLELTQFIPRLLEDHLSPVEALAASKAFLAGHAPSPDHRRKLAARLEALFPGERAKRASEVQRLVFAGKALLARSQAEQHARPIPAVVLEGGTTQSRMPPAARRSRPKVLVVGIAVLLAVASSAALVMANRLGHRFARLHTRALVSKDAVARVSPSVVPTPEASLPAPSGPEPSAPPPTLLARISATVPAAVTAGGAVARTPETHRRVAKLQGNKPSHESSGDPSDDPSVNRLLHAAETAFEAGHRVEAIELGRQASKAGGGLRADLALGKYYQNMHLYREAMEHYRAALAMDPDNGVAATGIRLLEKRMPPCE